MIELVGGTADWDPFGEVAGHDVARRPADRFNTPKQPAAHQRPAGERQNQSDRGAPLEHPQD
jgi:hypothetical protein